jgi:O-methyltransferase
MRLVTETAPTINTLITRQREGYPEIESETFWEFYEKCRDFSMVHVAGFYNIFQTMNYIAKNGITGNAVECGCFYGGVGAFIGLMRSHLGLSGMGIYLFDTFTGPPIGSTDTIFGNTHTATHSITNYAESVRENIESVLGSTDGYVFVPGMVEDTLPDAEVGQLALLRLDTDYYSSTVAEFKYLYPKLVRGGGLIVDDYGLFQGARRATDEYLASLSHPPLLNRIEQGVFAGVKP